MRYTVKKLSKIIGVSVRTLHYYDEIGLLKPLEQGENGYRYYGQSELLKLHQILFFKELEFSLEQIKEIMASPEYDLEHALEDQKKFLMLKKRHFENVILAIDERMTRLKGGERMATQDDISKGLDDPQLAEYMDEAKVRWGHTDAYKQSMERTKHWTKEDYKRIKEEGSALTQKIADAMGKGITHDEVQALIQQHHQSIERFYDCPLDMYKNLGQMYVDDPRFSAFYDKFRPGLAVFMRDAIAYFVEKQHR
jgi:DNA-binding transcriptional MerR regulator